MNDLFFSILVLTGGIAAGFFAYIIVSFIINRWDRFVESRKFKIRLTPLKKPLFFLMPSVAVLIGIPFARFGENSSPLIIHAVILCIMAFCGWLLVKSVYMFREMILSRYDFNARDNLRARMIYTQTRVISNIIVGAVIVLVASFMLMTFPAVKQIGVSLLASAGVLGVVLGFAAQKTLGNVIAGIQIALAQPIRLDDAVVVENEWGWIEEITLTYVVVRIWDLRRLVLPISYFVEKPFQNWTRTSADILGSVFLYTDYTVPVEEVRAELGRLLEKSTYWDKKVNVLQVTNATDRTIELRALMSAENSPTAWNLRCEIRERLLEFLQRKYPKSLPRSRVELDKV